MNYQFIVPNSSQNQRPLSKKTSIKRFLENIKKKTIPSSPITKNHHTQTA